MVLAERYVLDPVPLDGGGFADVYRASDLKVREGEPHGVVAIKVLRELVDVQVRRRFMRELRLISQCAHPNIVKILESGESDGGSLWYAMPLAKSSLSEMLDQYSGNDDRIAQVMLQVLAGVRFVHDLGTLHRDLKPANVLQVGTDLWAVSDFGLARETDPASTELTGTGVGMGSVFYTAPEVLRNAKSAVPSSDVYSLGKILHALVEGEHPIGSSPPGGRFRHVVERATRQKPDGRYQSVEDMEVAICRVMSDNGQWVNPEEEIALLAAAVAEESPSEASLLRLIDLVTLASRRDEIPAVDKLITSMSRGAIQLLWKIDVDGLMTIVVDYAAYIGSASLGFTYCDTVANFFQRLLLVTNDRGHLSAAVPALIHMGFNHTRWRVQSVVIGILQRVRDSGHAACVADAIAECDDSAVAWAINEFAAKSMHPMIRETVLEGHHRHESSSDKSADF